MGTETTIPAPPVCPRSSLSKSWSSFFAAEAAEKLNPAFESDGSRLTVIPTDDGEAPAYEFFGTYGGNRYYIYIDAMTGNEIEMFTVIGTAQGKALM